MEDFVRGPVQAKFLPEIGTMAFNSLRAEVQQTSNIRFVCKTRSAPSQK